MADIVLWKPALFGAKPEMIIKGGMIIASRWAIPMLLSQHRSLLFTGTCLALMEKHCIIPVHFVSKFSLDKN